jgi:hypothetical protein
MKKLRWKVLNALGIGASLQIKVNGYLWEKGWINIFEKRRSVDGKNNPIPWLSYPFLHFFEPRLKKEFSVFEFGAGNSTLWFQDRVGKVRSVEHSMQWFEEMKAKLKAHAVISYQPESENDAYAHEVLKDGDKYDLILVDASDRYYCTLYALQALTTTGVIILDNAERAEYKPIYELMAKEGFKNIEFEGMLAGTHVTDVTTVFYRQDNCLGI